jgi:hypothetical protein
VFFVGHAVEIGDDVYLAPIEGELDNPATLIPLPWVYDQMARCKARQKVLVMDVNRLNPGLGIERPNGGPMGAKIDAALAAPPPGVQVWSACVDKQQSYETGDSPMGEFLDELAFALAPVDKIHKGIAGIQRPEDPLPLDALRTHSEVAPSPVPIGMAGGTRRGRPSGWRWPAVDLSAVGRPSNAEPATSATPPLSPPPWRT